MSIVTKSITKPMMPYTIENPNVRVSSGAQQSHVIRLRPRVLRASNSKPTTQVLNMTQKVVHVQHSARYKQHVNPKNPGIC